MSQRLNDLRGRLRGNAAIASIAYGLDQGGILCSMTVDGVARTFPTGNARASALLAWGNQ